MSAQLTFLYALTCAFHEIPSNKSRNRDAMDLEKASKYFNHRSYVSSFPLLSLLTFHIKLRGIIGWLHNHSQEFYM